MKEYHEKAIQSLNLIKSENKGPLFLFTEQLLIEAHRILLMGFIIKK